MIRVNLLPFRLERKKENIRRQVSIFFLLILFSALVLVWYTLSVDRTIRETRQQTEVVKGQITKYKKKADRVTLIKKQLKILENKLQIVESLKTRRKDQLDLLEILPGQIVPGRMWIESLKSDAASVVITGISFDNPTIADFMKNLEASSRFSQINLKRSKIKKMGNDVMLKSFELVCMKKVSQPQGNDTKKKKGK
ncbi:PilN domain-containing protein [Desulfospira joergensenii]|uniref:PilN domain-containing protein n=1 Tax=Desulfospira joergensenii TaxID=53329 RepID=UPI0003B698E2|nr:PilN domain-containing protein [Desulfospira joergensenii]